MLKVIVTMTATVAKSRARNPRALHGACMSGRNLQELRF